MTGKRIIIRGKHKYSTKLNENEGTQNMGNLWWAVFLWVIPQLQLGKMKTNFL
jgi:hypothetical protein